MMKSIAIYSRKSKYTGTGDSIENQIEMCKDYAIRQFGKDLTFSVYEDEGFSGKNIERPEFQHLLQDIKEKPFDVLMCYRLDRISRSVSDFATILDLMTDHNISFVSIRESFDTSTPIGRAMVHIASVFAELERETIVERIKDNKYKLYRLGRWQGGIAPLGFKSIKVQNLDCNGDKRSYYKLEPVSAELETVRTLFDQYLELGSLSRLEMRMIQQRILTKNGKEYSKSTLKQLISNPVYATNDPCVYDFLQSQGVDLANERSEYDGKHGLIGFGKTVTVGTKSSTRMRTSKGDWIVAVSQHEGVISGENWVRVQNRLLDNREKFPRTDTSHIALLSGLIRCGKCGSPMMIKGNRMNADGEKSFYYKCSLKDRSGGELCDIKNISGIDFDRGIIDRLKQVLAKGGEVYDSLEGSSGKLEHKKIDYTKELQLLDMKIKSNDESNVNLAMRLSTFTDATLEKPIIEAMKRLSSENAGLKERRENLKLLRSASEIETLNLQLVRDTAKTFCEVIDTLDLNGRRQALKLLVRQIVWNGEDCEVNLFTDAISPKKNDPLYNLGCDRCIVDSIC